MAKIFSIIRSSLHVDPGVRTVLYIKGCPLHCNWCHNPEEISATPEILFYQDRCIKCGQCAVCCPECHIVLEETVTFRRTKCRGCGRCAEAYPNDALVMAGIDYTPE